MDYVARARAAAGALGPVETAGDDVGAAAALLAHHAGADLGPGAAGSNPGQRLVRRLVDWYLNVLIPPAAGLGQAAARMGRAVPERLDGIEARGIAAREAIRAELAALRDRVTALEDPPAR
ncbi:MAG: hypothetical protein ACRD0S_09135 [Acidimicrobiales bacterium]